MPTRIIHCCFVIAVCLATSVVSAQNPDAPRRVERGNGCQIVFSAGNSSSALVFDSTTGKCLTDVKSFAVVVAYPDQTMVTLKMFHGIYEPSNARVEKRKLISVKVITAKEFQALVDKVSAGQ